MMQRIRSVLLLLILLLAARPVAGQTPGAVLRVGPEQPYATIAAALADATPGDTIAVHGGRYPAPLVINKQVHMTGIDGPIIDGAGTGSLVLISASDVVFEGFTLQNSGDNMGREDTGIVIQGMRVTVANNVLQEVLFGIYFANAADGLARDNRIHCMERDLGMRGDGMRVWFSTDVVLAGNTIEGCRDTLIWYAENVTLENNYILNNRYGLHSMYSRQATLRDNVFEGNSVGSYLMYSSNATLTGNHFLWNRGPSGYGIAFKEMDYAVVEDNVLIGNRSGLYIDNSPSLVDATNYVRRNFIAYNDIGISALPSTMRNVFQSNTFLENYQQVSVLGRGNLLNNAWQVDGTGNHWSDYAGYDRDGDGIGDIPYRAEKLFDSLADQVPALRLFTLSPASQAFDFAASAFPSLRPDPKLIDDAPLITAVQPALFGRATQPQTDSFLAVSLGLVALGVGLIIGAYRDVASQRRGSQRWGAGAGLRANPKRMQ